MPDQSHLDAKYFIDPTTYNCPFCNRGHVSYEVAGILSFDWNDTKKAYIYVVKCNSCAKESMHLSYQFLMDQAWSNRRFLKVDIDDQMFFSVPSSFHVIDENIPATIRELLAEAEGSLKSNFLTGASACVRKVVYELARRENADGDNYEDRIKSLKLKLPTVDATYFDTLLTIQQLTSDKVHEESYDGWQAKHVRLILAALLEALNEIYVLPATREAKRKSILALKGDVFGPKVESSPGDAAERSTPQM